MKCHRLAFSLAALCLGGCSAGKVASATGSVITRTITTTGSVAGKTAMVAGKAATATTGAVVSATGSVAKAGVSATAGLAKTAVVTFVDSATGIAKTLPYVEGMKLYAASKTAEVNLALKSIQVLRGAQTLHTDARQLKAGKGDFALMPGDIVRLTSLATR